jgi:Lrp/AsnC family leucine-responsive transcriptional regulator
MPPEATTDSEIDRFDRAILDFLVEDGRITVTDLAQKVGLSKTPTQVRMRRLLDSGYILGFPQGAATPVAVSDWLIP